MSWLLYYLELNHGSRGMRIYLAAVLATLALQTAAFAEGRFALLIGNSRYEHASPLRNPENDVTLVAEALRGLDFSTTVATNLTLAGMKKALSAFYNVVSARPGATVLIYFAGHGVQVRGENLLLPVDVRVDDRDTLTRHALQMADLLTQLESLRSSIQILILDACRDDPFGTASRGLQRGLDSEEVKRAGRLIAFSTAPGKTAADGDSGTSPYASALAETLLVPGLRLEDVFARVRSKVLERTKGQQEPWETAALGEHPFYFLPPTGAGLDESEETLWDLASIVGTAESFQRYLTRFPEGRFASLARLRIEAYNKDQTFFRRNETFPIVIGQASKVGLCGSLETKNKNGLEHTDIMAFARLRQLRDQIAYFDFKVMLPNIMCNKASHGQVSLVPSSNASCADILQNLSSGLSIPNSRIAPECRKPNSEGVERTLANLGGGIIIDYGGTSVSLPMTGTDFWSAEVDAAEGFFDEASVRFRGFARVRFSQVEEAVSVNLEPMNPSDVGLSGRAENSKRRVAESDRLQANDVISLDVDGAGEIMVPTTLWLHNGSLIQLSKGLQGDRQLTFARPKAAMMAAGIEPGTVLFRGTTTDGRSYTGDGFVVSTRCKATYRLSGSVSADDRQIVLNGDIPRLDSNCIPVGSRTERMVFDLVGRADAINPDEVELDTLAAATVPSPSVAVSEPKRSSAAPSSFWSHNGSVVALTRSGNSRNFVYLKPRDGLDKVGVARGVVLYEGTSPDGRRYVGQARTFSFRCGSQPYNVSGGISEDGRRIELSGSAPVLDANCRRVGSKLDFLVFELIGSAQTTTPDGAIADFTAARR